MSCQSRHSHLLSSLPSVLVILVFSLVAVPVAAQTFTVLHSFTGYGDGSLPTAGLTADGTGNFYGTATSGGTNNHGTVFKLSSAGSGWVVTPIYSFQAGTDGAYPQARVVFGPDGTLYGTTTFGGAGAGYGTVFNLRPPAAACKTALCPWTETALYRFTGGSDGAYPELGDLTFDSSGNIYGTTGGGAGTSTVFKLSRSGQSWTFSVLYTFTCGNDGCEPYSGVIFDQAGNLYGTTTQGGALGFGTVYELSPSEYGWTETTLYSFASGPASGATPVGGLIFDSQGNLYGTTLGGGGDNGGTVYELQRAGDTWTYILLYSLEGYEGPEDSLTMDSSGNLYGTSTISGGIGNGAVFELAPGAGGWTYTGLHAFTGHGDGAAPDGSVIFDANGNIFGTAYEGGANDLGVIFEITP